MATTVTQLEFGQPDERAEQVMVAMRDGVRLATDVYLPAGVGRVPAVLVRLPYDKTQYAGPSGEAGFMPRVSAVLNDRGYAAVIQDVRGKVRSEGETFAFVREGEDGWDTLDWIVAQPWSSGVVGMLGNSYYGFTQWAAAASGHPALRAIVPRMTATEIGADWMYSQGVFCLQTMAGWAAYAWVDNALYDVELDWSVRPLADLLPESMGQRSLSLDAWRVRSAADRFWTEGIYGRDALGRIDIPVLHSGGWFDVFSRGQLRDFARLRGRSNQHLVMGATDHFGDELLRDGQAPVDVITHSDALGEFLPRYLGPALEFFDRHLAGRDGSVIPVVRWQLAGAGWRESSSWPPPEARPLRFFLSDNRRAGVGPEGGMLALEPGRVETVEWVHDPSALVPSLTDDPWRPLLGLPDERDVEVRDDVLTFTAEPVTKALDLAGPVRAHLALGSDGDSLQVVVKLVDVFPNGRARRILEGAAHLRTAEGGAVVDLGSTGYRLPAGHRLRVEVAGSSFPRFIWHPGTNADPWTATRSRVRRHDLALGDASSIELTVLPTKEGQQ